MCVEEALIQLVRCAYQLQERHEIDIVDWQELCRLSDRHRVAPALAPVAQDNLPGPAQEWIDAARMKAAQQSLLVRRVLDYLAEALAAQGIQALILKGIALQDWVYGHQQRMTGDIDLFVRLADTEKLADILRVLGFHPSPRAATRTWRDGAGVEIDVHTSMLEPYLGAAAQFDEVWERRMELDSLPLPTLSPVDHLVFVLVHGWKHQWCRLSWVVDTALIAQRLNLQDWYNVCEQAQRQRALRIVLVGLDLCRQVLQPPGVPWDRVIGPSCSVVEQLAGEYRRRLFRPVPNSSAAKLRNVLLHLRALEGGKLQGQYIAGRLRNGWVRMRGR